MRACLESCFDLHLLQGTNDRRVYMSAAQNSLAKIHKIRDRMVLIVNNLAVVSNDNKHGNEGEMYLMKDSSNKSLSMLVGERMNRRIDIYSSFQVIQLLPFQKTPLSKATSLREEKFLQLKTMSVRVSEIVVLVRILLGLCSAFFVVCQLSSVQTLL